MKDAIVSLISLAIIIAPFYFVIRFFRKRSDKKVKRAIEQHRLQNGYSNEPNLVEQVEDKVFNPSKNIIFIYLEDDKPVRKEIIGHYRSDYFLEGYNLKSQQVEYYEVEKIVGFLGDTESIYESLLGDPSLLTEDEILDLENKAQEIENKDHPQWDRNNPNEVFFKYRNSLGEIRDRVVLLLAFEDPYLKGICKVAKGIRTFREDRILTYYEDSRERIDRFKANPHNNRNIISISFIGFSDTEFDQYKLKGDIYNYRALKTITKNTALIVVNKELTPSQQDKAEQYGCAFVLPEDFSHFLETGEVQSVAYQEPDDDQEEEREYLNSDRDFEGFDIYNDPYIDTEAKANRNNPEVITFIYTKEDSNGKIVAKQERAIIPYYRNDERLEGYCLDENEGRAFWIDRIEKFTGNSKRVFDQMD